VGAEDAGGQPGLEPDLFQPGRAAKPVRPVAQHLGDDLVVADDDDLAPCDAELEEWPVLRGPGLQLLVQSWVVQLQRIAEQRQAVWTGRLSAWRTGVAVVCMR
jgi:hypothetical protein